MCLKVYINTIKLCKYKAAKIKIKLRNRFIIQLTADLKL